MKRAVVSTVMSVFMVSGALMASPGSADPSPTREAFASPPAATARAVKRTPGNLGGSDLFVEGELVVQFKKGVKRAAAMDVHHRRGGYRVLNRVGGFGGRIEHVQLAPGVSVARALRRYRRDPSVAVAEPNFRYRLLTHLPAGLPLNDSEASPTMHLWGLQNAGQAHKITDPEPPTVSGTDDADIDVEEAWVTDHGDGQPIVAVVDSGVDIMHQDLDDNLWENPAEVPGNAVDEDGNGCADDIHGRAFGYPCTDLSDVADHGTHVAGTIAAEADNNEAVAGVCPHCRIMVLKFDLTTAAEVAAYAYARQKGARVINGSFGGPVWSKVSYNAIKKLGNAGIVAVFAAGNDALDNDTAAGNPGTGGLSPSFPASYNLPNIIAVAASNHHDEYGYFTGCHAPTGVGGEGRPKGRCAFSNVGRESVDLAAPGVDIVSTVQGGVDVYNGTSMAAPHVAGVAGLVRSEFPALGPEQVKNKIMNGTDKPSSLRTFYSGVLKGKQASGMFTRTNGRLNAAGALATGTAGATKKSDGDIPGAKKIGRSKKGRVAYPNDVNDVFKKKLRKGKVYRATLRVGKSDFDLWVWKPGTKQIWQFEPSCFSGKKTCPVAGASFKGKGKNEVVTFKATKKGFYYFHVTAWLKFKGGYKLIVKQV